MHCIISEVNSVQIKLNFNTTTNIFPCQISLTTFHTLHRLDMYCHVRNPNKSMAKGNKCGTASSVSPTLTILSKLSHWKSTHVTVFCVMPKKASTLSIEMAEQRM